MSIEGGDMGVGAEKIPIQGGCIGIVINCDLILSYSYYS